MINLLINEQKLKNASKQELIQEHKRLQQELTRENSAVKNKDDLSKQLVMECIKNFLQELHGLKHSEIIALDNPNN